MNIDKKIEELRKEFNEKIEKLKEENEKEKIRNWIPKEIEVYYYVDETMEIVCCTYHNDKIDNEIIKYYKIFKTKEEAQEYADYLKARKEYSYEFSKEEWKDDGIDKCCISYDYEDSKMRIITYNSYRYQNQIYFKTQEKAQEFIENYKKQILKFEFDIGEE